MRRIQIAVLALLACILHFCTSMSALLFELYVPSVITLLCQHIGWAWVFKLTTKTRLALVAVHGTALISAQSAGAY
jgi:hypothetical protein